MKVKRTIKTLTAVLMSCAAILAPFSAWADGWVFVPPTITENLNGPGTIVNWEVTYQCTSGNQADPNPPFKEIQFEIWRGEEHIDTVTGANKYCDLGTVAGEVCQYTVKALGMSYVTPRRCYGSYHPWVEKEVFHIRNKGTNCVDRISVLKKLWTQDWYESDYIRSGPWHIVESFPQWTAVSSAPDWLKIVGADKNGKIVRSGTNDVAFTVEPNMTASERMARISIFANADPKLTLKEITVVQDAGPAGFAINFDPCGGTGDTTWRLREDGERLGDLPVLTRKGYYFMGWYTEADGGERVTAETTASADVTYFARWVQYGVERSFTDANGITWTYTILPTGGASLGNGNGHSAVETSTSGDLSIPSVLDEFEVVAIGPYAFADCSLLTGVTIPQVVTNIGYRAFAGCTELSEVTIPASRDGNETMLGQGVFSGCTSLETVTFGDTVKTLPGVSYGGVGSFSTTSGKYGDSSSKTSLSGSYADALFYNCTSLKTINWGTGIKAIGNVAFLYCTSLTDLTLPANITDIGNHAFFGCSSLKTVTVMGNVNSIGRYAFGNCPALHYVDFQGVTMTSAPGYMPFKFDREQVTVYAAAGSTGWNGQAEVEGLPESGIWGGARIAYAPPPEGAGNPYDFYPYVRTDTISRVNYPWSMIVTTSPYVSGRTVPAIPSSIYDDETLYLSYCLGEYWRGEAFCVTNEVVLSGARSAAHAHSICGDAHSSSAHWWVTNAVLPELQSLPVGDYTLTCTINFDGRLPETDYSNNSTSITFRVLPAPLWTVSFNPNSGTVDEESRQVKRNTAIGELPVPVRLGYAFTGWFTKTSGGTQVTADAPVTSESVTLYARWAAKPQYTITFNANGGSSNETRTLYDGDPLGELPKPTKAGCFLLGWFTEASGGTQVTERTLAVGATTYYAHWQQGDGRYKVTFGKNGGTGGDSYVTVTYGQPMPTPRTAPTQSGWTFAGYWDTVATDANGNPKGKQYYDANMKSMRNWDKQSDTILWAKWTVKVTLGKNGGTGGDSYVTVTKGQSFPKRTMPKKTGYAFGGYWVSASSKTGQCYNVDGTGTESMKWTTGGSPTIWALWTTTSSCVDISQSAAAPADTAAPNASAAPAAAELAELPAGLYSGVLADCTGSFCLILDEAEEGLARTAYLYVASEIGTLTAECTAEEVGGALLLTTEDGDVYAFDPLACTLVPAICQ